MQEDSTKELTPLPSRNDSIDIYLLEGNINAQSVDYGAISETEMNSNVVNNTQCSIQIGTCDLLIFYLIYWNVNISKKLFFPFIIQFSAYYDVSIISFSLIVCSYEIGCILSNILNILYTFHHIQIRILLFLLIITVCLSYFISRIFNTFLILFIVRLFVGFSCNITYTKLKEIIDNFPKSTISNLKSGNNGIGSNFGSTMNWIIIAILLQRTSIEYIWNYLIICAGITACFCYYLPHCNISEALSSISNQDYNKIELRPHLIWYMLNGFFLYMSYYAFLSTFGIWITTEFELIVEQFGYELVIIALAEYIGYSLYQWLKKFETKSIHISMWTQTGSIIAITALSIAVAVNSKRIFVIWIFIFMYTMFMEMVFVSLNNSRSKMLPMATNLFNPRFRKINSFIDIVRQCGAISGIISSLCILKGHGFLYVLQSIMVIQFIGLLCICMTHYEYQRFIKIQIDSIILT